MKQILFVIVFCINSISNAQELKTYDGLYKDGHATYTYFEKDDGSRIYHGKFTYSRIYPKNYTNTSTQKEEIVEKTSNITAYFNMGIPIDSLVEISTETNPIDNYKELCIIVYNFEDGPYKYDVKIDKQVTKEQRKILKINKKYRIINNVRDGESYCYQYHYNLSDIDMFEARKVYENGHVLSSNIKYFNNQEELLATEVFMNNERYIIDNQTGVRTDLRLNDSDKAIEVYIEPSLVISGINDKKYIKEARYDSETHYDIISPEYPGGMSALLDYLGKNIRYPSIVNKNGIHGRVIVKFIVAEDGSIIEPQVIKSLEPSCDKEVLRVVQSMPKWKPGKGKRKDNKKTENIRIEYTVPILF